MDESRKMALIAYDALDDKKAENISMIDIAEISTLGDYFIIANGHNRNQVQAMADAVEEELGKAGFLPKQIEGYQTANWILLDYRDVIIHVFSEEDREFYDLERIWRDGKPVTREELAE
jgi:ribosome-associated protein